MPLNGPIPDDARHQVLFRLIGQFITNWCHVEWALAFVFAALTRTDLNRARIILAAMQNFRARRDLIDRLGRAYLPERDLQDFSALIAQIKHLSEKRNHLAHRRVYYMNRSTFRFFSDEDETQPNTFGRYTDYQTGNIRSWTKEVSTLERTMYDWWRRIGQAQLLTQPRVIPEPDRDHET